LEADHWQLSDSLECLRINLQADYNRNTRSNCGRNGGSRIHT
jgi:hypothetical protein